MWAPHTYRIYIYMHSEHDGMCEEGRTRPAGGLLRVQPLQLGLLQPQLCLQTGNPAIRNPKLCSCSSQNPRRCSQHLHLLARVCLFLLLPANLQLEPRDLRSGLVAICTRTTGDIRVSQRAQTGRREDNASWVLSTERAERAETQRRMTDTARCDPTSSIKRDALRSVRPARNAHVCA